MDGCKVTERRQRSMHGREGRDENKTTGMMNTLDGWSAVSSP